VFPHIAADLVLTDPPFGINADKGTNGFGTSKARRYQGGWDQKIPDQKYFDAIRACSKHQIIFGGNYFTKYLPPTKSWILWDKVGGYHFKNPFSNAEMAWTSLNIPTRKITVVQQGFVTGEKGRYHPTQKPVKLLTQILSDYSRENDLVFDPYMGSGSVGVACVRLQRRFTGVEIDPHYFEIAYQRIAEAVNDQQNMFPCLFPQETQQRFVLEPS
jgi:DNA modification methylase